MLNQNFFIFSAAKQIKWKSAWDLTEKEKEKVKKKRKKSLIHQGLLDLMSIGDAAVGTSALQQQQKALLIKKWQNPGKCIL